MPETTKPATPPAAEQHFWTQRHDYGSTHTANPAHPGYLPEVLFVFIHGWFGGSESTWGTLAEVMLKELKCDADVLSFRYPTAPWFRSSIRKAADDLATVLKTPPLYQHYVIVTHSTGGLVAKELFRSEFREMGLLGGKATTEPVRTVCYRTPLILNVAAAHAGASKSGRAALKPLYRFFWGIYKHLSPALDKLTGGKHNLGYNSLIPTLVDDHRWFKGIDRLDVLETDYSTGIRQLDDAAFPRPRSIEILAGNDIIIETYGMAMAPRDQRGVPRSRSDMDRVGESSGKQYTLRGTHQSVKLPKSVNSKTPMVDVAVSQLRHFLLRPSVVIARGAIDLIQDRNRQEATRNLLGPSQGTSQSDDRRFDQQTALERLIDLSTVKRGAPLPIMVTGEGGMGKSTVLRSLTARLAEQFLCGIDDAPLPVFLPLQQFTVDQYDADAWDQNTPTVSPWMVMAAKWTAWVQSVVDDMIRKAQWSEERSARAPKVTSPWLNEWMSHRPVTLILDSVDEFLLKNPAVTLQDIWLLIDDVRARFANNTNLTIIVGIRSGYPELRNAIGDVAAEVEIRRPTLDEAKSIAPGVEELAAHLNDPELVEIMLTPLIFVRLATVAGSAFGKGRLRTKTDLLEAALTAMVEKSGLRESKTADGKPLTSEVCLAAMELIVWRMYVQQTGQTSATEIATGAGEDVEAWHQYVARAGLTGQDATLTGFKAVGDAATVEKILRRTVFPPTGSGRYRGPHREWEDLLLARYVERCFRTKNFGELRHHAIRRDIFRMVAQRVGHVKFTQEDVEGVLAKGKETTQFVPGNFFAFVSVNPKSELDGPGIALLLKMLEHASPLVACTLLNGFANRALSAVEGDHTGRQIATDLMSALPGFIARRGRDPIMASEAWCFRVALEDLLTPSASTPATGYQGLSEAEEQVALGFICDTTESTYRTNKVHRSFQRAFLELAGAVRAEPKVRVISSVHYLYYLALAYKHRGYVESAAELGRILSKESNESAIIAGYEVVPEVRMIFERCQALGSALALPKGN